MSHNIVEHVEKVIFRRYHQGHLAVLQNEAMIIPDSKSHLPNKKSQSEADVFSLLKPADKMKESHKQ